MATGDDALAAGMALTPGTVMANTIDDEINKTRDYIAQRTSAVVPIAKGGTGATTAAAARSALAVVGTGSPNAIELRWAGSRLKVKVDSSEIGDVAIGDIPAMPDISGKLDKTGGTLTGDLFIPGSSAATSGYTNAFINVDGRVSRGASSERYKENITPAPELGDLFAVTLDEFEMIDGDGTRIIGYIAEKLAANPDTARFVVYDTEGRADSIDWFQLLMSQVALLHARVAELEANR